jgi:RNA polymerase sigma factor for flagellar operon FliA
MSSADSHNMMSAYIGLVRALAWKIHQQLPRSVDLDDLVGYGCVGLAEASQSFDPDRGLKFSTFAYHRVRGAILDGLSQMSWFRRDKFAANEYRRDRDGDGDRQESSYASEGEPAEAHMYDNGPWVRDAAERLSRKSLGPDVVDTIPDKSHTSEQSVMQREAEARVRQLVDTLPQAAAELLRATYYEGLSLKDAAQRVGRDKSWASRLHARAIRQLAMALKAEGYG